WLGAIVFIYSAGFYCMYYMVGIRQEEKQLYSGKLLAMPFCALLYCHRNIHLRHIQIIWLPYALSEHGRNGQFVRRSYAHAAIMAIYRVLYTLPGLCRISGNSCRCIIAIPAYYN